MTCNALQTEAKVSVSDEANVLDTGVEDSDSQETQCDELRQLVDAFKEER